MFKRNLLILLLILLTKIIYGVDNLQYKNEILTDIGIRKIGLIEEIILSDSFINKLTIEEKKELKKIKKLKIKYETEKNMVTFCSKHEEFKGLIPDVLKAFGKKCNIEIETIQHSISSKNFQNLLINNEIDMIISSTKNNMYLKNFIRKDGKICLDKKDKIKLRFFIKKDKIVFFNILIKFKEALREENQIIEYLQLKDIEKNNVNNFKFVQNKYLLIILIICFIIFFLFLKSYLDLKKDSQTGIGNKISLDEYIDKNLKDEDNIILISLKGVINLRFLLSMKLILIYIFNKKNIYRLDEKQFCILGKIKNLDEKLKKLEKQCLCLIKNKNIKIIVSSTVYKKELNIYSYFNYMDRKSKKDIENVRFKYKIKKIKYEDIIEYENYKKKYNLLNKEILNIEFKYFLIKNPKNKEINNILVDFFITQEKEAVYFENKDYKENLEYKLIENAVILNKKILNLESVEKRIGIIVIISKEVFLRDNFIEELLKILKKFTLSEVNLILGLSYENFIGKENKKKINELRKLGVRFLLNNIDINKIDLLNFEEIDYLFVNNKLLDKKITVKIKKENIILQEKNDIYLYKSEYFLLENNILKRVIKY